MSVLSRQNIDINKEKYVQLWERAEIWTNSIHSICPMNRALSWFDCGDISTVGTTYNFIFIKFSASDLTCGNVEWRAFKLIIRTQSLSNISIWQYEQECKFSREHKTLQQLSSHESYHMIRMKAPNNIHKKSIQQMTNMS